ncbi:MAG: hypothetical protein SOX32_12855 [Candidatus Choladocola sp.]|nr:hypothetical protein [Candidatus Choladocola sp.]
MDWNKLLGDIRNYLDITYEDSDTDKKLEGIIKRGMNYLDNVAGDKQDYEKEELPRSLLFDYCRYTRNNAFEIFETNFKAELIALRIGVQTDDFAWQQGYI